MECIYVKFVKIINAEVRNISYNNFGYLQLGNGECLYNRTDYIKANRNYSAYWVLVGFLITIIYADVTIDITTKICYISLKDEMAKITTAL